MIRINGQPRPPLARLNTVVNFGGTWHMDDLGPVSGDCHAYQWTREGSPHRRVWIVRQAATRAAKQPKVKLPQIDYVRFLVDFGQGPIDCGVVPGAVRTVESGPLVTPDWSRLKQAIRDHWLPAYTRRPLAPWHGKGVANTGIKSRGTYNPAFIAAQDGVSQALGTGSMMHYCGVLSGMGGEYAASRGWTHDDGARVIDRVLEGQPIGDEHAFLRLTWEALASPQAAMWSFSAHSTADAQLPFEHDPRYFQSSGTDRDPTGRYMAAIEGWSRDSAHLENVGFEHWLATGDPDAALVVQRQLAFCLWQTNSGVRKAPGYKADAIQERTAWNNLRALYQAWAIARANRQASDCGLWGFARIDAMVRAIVPQYVAELRGDNAGAVEREALQRLGCFAAGMTKRAHGAERWQGPSTFMAQQYGAEFCALSAANPLWPFQADSRAWLARGADWLAANLLWVGGDCGVAQMPRGSAGFHKAVATLSLDRKQVVSRPAYGAAPDRRADLRAWADWYLATFARSGTEPLTDRFVSPGRHTLRRMVFWIEAAIAVLGERPLWRDALEAARATAARSKEPGDSPGAMLKNRPVVPA